MAELLGPTVPLAWLGRANGLIKISKLTKMSIGAVTVLISGGFIGTYEQLLPEFEWTNGIKVTTRSGASQGVGPQTIAAQLRPWRVC